MTFKIADFEFNSRLLLGTGKFQSDEMMKKAIIASGAEIITAALRRIDVNNPNDVFLNVINPNEFIFLTNTSGARTADEAIRLARLGATQSAWVKLELTPEPNHLLPDPIETLKAAEVLVKDGLIVLPYINADPILCKRLEDVGCQAVMPLGSPIGTNQGLSTKLQLEIIIQNSNVPVIIDAGIGAPSHAAEAMEMGADAVLVNTAIATAGDPISMAVAFKQAVESGRMAFNSGLAKKSVTSVASSPLTGFFRLMYSTHYAYKETIDKYNQVMNLGSIADNQLFNSPYYLFSSLSDEQLELLAQKAKSITRQRFGNVMRFFIPLYLSNECFNNCSYCGFSFERNIHRYTLSDKEIETNVKLLVNRGFQHILLLTGESSKK